MNNKIVGSIFSSRVHSFFKIKLLFTGRKKSKYYKIIIVNGNNRYVDLIGAYYPNRLRLFLKKRGVIPSYKLIWLDVEKLSFWLRKKVIVGPFMYQIIKSLGH